MSMVSNPRFWIPFGCSLFFTLALGVVGAASIGSGANNYFAVMVLFPFAMLLTSALELSHWYMIGIALLQFPLYGAYLGRANFKGFLGFGCLVVMIVHALAVMLVLLVAQRGS